MCMVKVDALQYLRQKKQVLLHYVRVRLMNYFSCFLQLM